MSYRFRTSAFSGFPFYPMHYVSHALIIIAVIVSFFWFASRDLITSFWLHKIPVSFENFPYILGQIILYQFLHGGLFHILMNSIFLYQAGPEVEARMTRRWFLLFFLGNTFFVALSLWFLSSGLTIGISGFCMALLSYLYMDLARVRHPMANQVLIMLVINIALWLTGNISFVGHAAGAVWGIVWWYLRKH